jgi:hypothetical protein
MSGLALEPGERVLWEGRAAVGDRAIPLREAATVTTVIVGGTSLVMLVLARDAPEIAATAIGGLALVGVWTIAIVALARWIGPHHVESMVLSVGLVGLGGTWATDMSRLGWEGALEAFGPDRIAIFGVMLGLPALRMALDVGRRLRVTYVVTDRRVASLQGDVVLWVEPRGTVRRGAPEHDPCVVIGARTLFLRGDDPARVIDAVTNG